MFKQLKNITLLLLLVLAVSWPAAAGPRECLPDLAALLGFYQGEGENILIRERGGRLELLYGVTARDYAFAQANIFQMVKSRYDEYTLNIANPRDLAALAVNFERDRAGTGITLIIEKRRFTRRFFPDEKENPFTITPVKSLAELRLTAKAAAAPPQAAGLLTAELVEIAKPAAAADIIVNMVYAGRDNIFGEPAYEDGRAFLDKGAALALQRAHKRLAAYGYGLVLWDAYRPWYISKAIYDALPEADKGLLEDPMKGGSPHNKGLSADVSLFSLADGQQVKMISGFDEPSLRALRDYQGGSELARWQREILRMVMESEGFSGVDYEWWHYEYKDAAKYRLLNIAPEEIS